MSVKSQILVGGLVALAALAASASPAIAAPVHATAVSVRPAIVTPNAETSIFIAYPKGNYGGNPTNISGCGGHNMPYAVGSYQWLARGQSGYMYNQKNEQGTRVATLDSGTDASSPKGVGWKSIFIVC